MNPENSGKEEKVNLEEQEPLKSHEMFLLDIYCQNLKLVSELLDNFAEMG